jgi:hypothetical protein
VIPRSRFESHYEDTSVSREEVDANSYDSSDGNESDCKELVTATLTEHRRSLG